MSQLLPVWHANTVKFNDSKPTKSVGHFEENKFSVVCHQFLLECCPKLIKTCNFGQNAAKKDNLKTKMNNIVQLGCLFSKLPRLFVNFSSAIVLIFTNHRMLLIVDVKLNFPVNIDGSQPFIFKPLFQFNGTLSS